ncbi:MAG TPA: LptA/OstA family protein [Alphaproteobacteria bacterium]|nr:LptA/OstA family protein [Alphaproteobacteria bacterium]
MKVSGTILRIAAVLLALALAPEVRAQALNLGGGSSGQPIEILARDGIEWNREAKQYIARGDARASQAGTTVEADVLTAYYREGASSRTEIYRYQAEGNVRIYTPTHRAVGDRAIFDIDTGVLVLTGKGLKLTTPGEVVTARDALEYWDRRQIAVARGDAVVLTQDGRRMKGDLLTAHFTENRAAPGASREPPQPRPQTRSTSGATPGSQGDTQRLQRIEAFGDVHVSTEAEIAVGDRGVYNADTGIAVLAGNVKITRGKNQLNGDYAEVNTNTGISRLLSDSRQVRGLFVPESQKDGTAPIPGRRTP